MKRSIFAAAVVLISSVPLAHADTETNPITNFREVSSGIYRGARPGQAGIAYLATELQIKTDLDLENDDGAISAEKGYVAAEPGLTMVSLPMSAFSEPSDQTVSQALAILSDPTQYPVFVHCEHGQDRTGLIVGLFRIDDQHMTPADAYTEMLQDGFHPALVALLDYFEKATGYHP